MSGVCGRTEVKRTYNVRQRGYYITTPFPGSLEREVSSQAIFIAFTIPSRDMNMARILITGSSDGIGQAAAKLLASQGHKVTLHARNDDRAAQAHKAVPQAEGVLVGDLSTIAGSKDLAEKANKAGPLGCRRAQCRHGLLWLQDRRRDHEHVCGEQPRAVHLDEPDAKPKRLLYLSSGLHSGGDDSLNDVTWSKRPFEAHQAYSDSKLHDIMLANAVARRWPDVQSCSLDPGWVQTKMGGGSAPGTTTLRQRGYCGLCEWREEDLWREDGAVFGSGRAKGAEGERAGSGEAG